jgi:serine/threonine protein kinase
MSNLITDYFLDSSINPFSAFDSDELLQPELHSRLKEAMEVLVYPYSQKKEELPPKTHEIALRILAGYENPLKKEIHKKFLGAGAFGRVEYHQYSDGTEYAVKTLFVHGQEGFDNEYLTFLKLKHPNIVRLLHADSTHLYMEYIPGSLLSNTIFDEAEFFSIWLKIAEAVCYIHSQGYIHGDIKGDNILIIKDKGIVKLIDFDAARKESKFDFDIRCFLETFRDSLQQHKYLLSYSLYEKLVKFIRDESSDISSMQEFYDWLLSIQQQFEISGSKKRQKNSAVFAVKKAKP